MAVWYSTPLSEAVRDNRWAAEFHRPGYKFEAKTPEKWRKIGACSRQVQYGLSIKMNEVGRGVPIYRLNEIDNCFLGDSPSKYAPIASSVAQQYRLEPNDVLFCRTNGNIKYVGRTGIFLGTNNAVFASYLVKVKTNPDVIRPEYLTIYLNTRFGRRQILRRAMPSNQVNVSAAELKRIDILLLDSEEQDEVANLVVQAHEGRRKAFGLIQQADRALESEIGFDSLPLHHEVGYAASLSDAVVGNRIDGEYFQPKYQALRDAIKSYKHGFELIIQVADALKPNIDPSQAPASDFNYVELSQINSALGMIEGHTESSGAGLPSRARRQVNAGDVIASAVVGSVDKVALISSGEDGYIASTGFFHFRPKTVSPEYLLMLVRSRCVSMQFQQQATGGILSAVPDGRLKYVIVPRFPQKLQDKVTDLVAQAHQAKRESDALLEKAKARVEQLIEEAIEQ